jgi:hypothetical protein
MYNKSAGSLAKKELLKVMVFNITFSNISVISLMGCDVKGSKNPKGTKRPKMINIYF